MSRSPELRLCARLLSTAALAVVLAVVSAARTVGAQGDEHRALFREALKAIDRGTWREAEPLLRRAAALEPRAGERIRVYGTRVEVYLPHFYLGLVRFELSDCAGALRAWDAAEAQAAVRGQRKAYKKLQRLRGQCPPPPPPLLPLPPPDEPDTTEPDTTDLPSDSVTRIEIEGSADRIDSTLEGGVAAPLLPPPAAPAAVAESALISTEDGADDVATDDASAPAVPDVTPPPPPLLPPPLLPPPLLPPPLPPPTVEEPAPPPPQPPPIDAADRRRLRAAAVALLVNDYGQVETLLGDFVHPAPKMQRAINLLRAAARFARACRGERNAKELRAAAARDLAALRALGLEAIPEIDMLSPRFRTFLERARQAGGELPARRLPADGRSVP